MMTVNDVTNISDDFRAALAKWLAGADARIAEHMAKHYPALPAGHFEIEDCPKYLRIVRCNPQRVCFAFIAKADGTTKTLGTFKSGDVLKSASWKTPARVARGNIFDADNGLARTGVYGVG